MIISEAKLQWSLNFFPAQKQTSKMYKDEINILNLEHRFKVLTALLL